MRSQKSRLQDILDSVDSIHEFTRNMTYDTFRDDRKTNLAVVRLFEIIGEAIKNVEEQLKGIASRYRLDLNIKG